MEVFDAAIPIAREAISERRLGFGGRYYVRQIRPLVAVAQKEADDTRPRRNFEMHLALQPHLLDWFHALSDVLPGRVSFGFPEYEALLAELTNHPGPDTDARRFDESVLDELLERLPS